jgi:hypothetical protein
MTLKAKSRRTPHSAQANTSTVMVRREPVREALVLMRGRVPVASLLGALGASLRETRITAMLGYLIAHDPGCWQSLFRLSRPISSVGIEADYERDRADITIDTPTELIVVEAKVSWADPKEQARRYDGDRKYLFTNYVPKPGQSSSRLSYVTWSRVATFLKSLIRGTGRPYVRHLAKELIQYMREHQLIRSRDSVEIYARELNDELTLSTFLKCQVYGCRLEKGGGTISRALYFAPHLGQRIARQHPGIFSGVSYVSRIEAVEVTDTWQSFEAAATRQRGRRWLRKHRDLLQRLRSGWTWNSRTQRSIAFLGTPRLVFNPPINKNLLQKGRGWLSRRTFTFDEMFDAWSKSGTAKIG